MAFLLGKKRGGGCDTLRNLFCKAGSFRFYTYRSFGRVTLKVACYKCSKPAWLGRHSKAGPTIMLCCDTVLGWHDRAIIHMFAKLLEPGLVVQ